MLCCLPKPLANESMLLLTYFNAYGFLPQDFGFHPEFTVKDYLAYVAALKGLPERQSWRRIRELLEREIGRAHV